MNYLERENAILLNKWHLKYLTNCVEADPWPPYIRDMFNRELGSKLVHARAWLTKRFGSRKPVWVRVKVAWSLAARRQARMGR
jgi:hypothetical protein